MIYAIVSIIILGLIAAIVKYWNGPKTSEQERLAAEARYKAQDERRDDITERIATRMDRRDARRKERQEARQNKP